MKKEIKKLSLKKETISILRKKDQANAKGGTYLDFSAVICSQLNGSCYPCRSQICGGGSVDTEVSGLSMCTTGPPPPPLPMTYPVCSLYGC